MAESDLSLKLIIVILLFAVGGLVFFFFVQSENQIEAPPVKIVEKEYHWFMECKPDRKMVVATST